MSLSTFWQAMRRAKSLSGNMNRRFIAKFLGVCVLIAIICIELVPLIGHAAYAQLTPLNHTNPSVDYGCRQVYFSADGNPFGLCPGPAPRGGNCVWWPWEQWHRLGYDLPRNWGNAADWIADAERDGLPLGKTPRVGSIAVFPIADGVWAFGTAGHVAFVTAVSADSSTFDVTYQNYGDPTPMFTGRNYPVSVINEPRFQRGNLRFIYFPRPINPQSFAQLPGIGGNVSFTAIAHANSQLMTSFDGTSSPSVTGNQIALGLPSSSSDQEYNADFAGVGLSDLLLYNRAKGSLGILSLADELIGFRKRHLPRFAINEILANQSDTSNPQLVPLGDSITPVNGWGSALDIHIGDFTGIGRSEILLYDRVSGKLQLLSLTPQLTIQKHVVFAGYGSGYELYIGQFAGQRSEVFMYNRLLNALPVAVTPTPTTDTSSSNGGTTPTVPTGTTATPTTGTTPTATPTTGTTPTPSPTATHTPTPTPTPSPTATHTPTPTPSPTATHTPTPTPTPRPSPTPSPTPNPCATAGASSGLDSNLRRCPTPTPALSIKIGTTQILIPNVQQYPNSGGGGGPSTVPGTVVDKDMSSQLSGTLPPVLVTNVIVLSFNVNFAIQQRQQYTLEDTSWEVYVGNFVSATRAGVLLYDRLLGEVRLLSFDNNLHVVQYKAVHSVDPNWEVHSGDFMGAGRDQVLVYNPTSGDAEIWVLKSDLSVASKQSYTGWGTNQVLYVGHFGTPTLNIMLYDPQAIQSTFDAFDATLTIVHQYIVPSWDNRWQILIGSFLDRSRCLASHDCATGDDILVLDRQNGQIQQYIFNFGNQYQATDNRSQGFVRSGQAPSQVLTGIDASIFNLEATLNTTIRGEELY